MRLNAIKLTVVFALFLYATPFLYGQLSKIHYVPPIGAGTNVGDQYLYISTPNKGYINVTVKPLAGSRADWVTQSIKNDEPWVFPIYSSTSGGINSPVVKDLDTYSTQKVKDGYIVESTDVTYVSFRINSESNNGRQFHSGAYVSKGEAALGTRFRPGNFVGATGFTQQGSPTYAENFVSILAVEDDTRVELSEIPSGLVIIGYTGAFPIVKELDKGETWILGTTTNTSDLNPLNEVQLSGFTGTLITSTDVGGTSAEKPVVVVSGSLEGTALRDETRGNRDYGFDQIVEANKIGYEYIVVKGLGDDRTENVYVIADSDGTEVYKGNDTTPIPLNKGEYIVFDYLDYDSTNNNLYITTKDPNKKLFVYQTTGYDSVANQALVFVPPLSCSSRGNIDNIPQIDKIGDKVFTGGSLTIVTKDTAALEIYKDGVLFADKSGTTAVNLNTFARAVVGKTGYSTYLLDSSASSTLIGSISVFSDEELYVASTTYGDAASSGSYYSGFVSNPPIQNDLSVSTLGTCVLPNGASNTKLTTPSTYDTYEWQKYNNTTDSFESAPGTNNDVIYEPTLPGKYRLLGKLSCFPTKEYISDVVVVSICPNDYDSDGIPDTIDLDRDNDGILNTFESFGKGTIDFSTPLAPSIVLPNNPTNTILGTATISPATADVVGNSSGEITSTIPFSGLNEKTEYLLNPILPTNQPLNIRLGEVAGSTTSEFETMTLIVYPPTENITLLDLGEKLLVDDGTGFKRVPAEGLSGNQIKFKYNPNPLDGNIPFEILGVNVTGIDLIHELGALASANAQFNILIEIIDYEKDTDGDLKIDSLDNNSDTDDCSDMIEAGHEELLGVGSALYDPNNPNSTIDQRGRFVFNGYDYTQLPEDNDNNGIYDFQEAETPATLSEDFSTSTMTLCEGESLVLSLKTPDSDVVTWEVDTDRDGVFEAADGLGTTSNNADSYSFQIDAIPASLDQAIFRARIKKNTYACTTDTKLLTLTVNTNDTKPDLDPLTIVCEGATVANLGVTDVVWYETATGGSPLPENTLLKHNTPYFAANVVNGCVGALRSETKVVINNPIISTSSGNTTFCANEAITLTLDTDKILPSPDDFARINNLIYLENALGPVEYDNGFYYTQKGIKTGVQPITWPSAKALGESVVGATMYIINSASEENAVFEALQYMGLSGDDGIAFWLGLFQDTNASDYSEPAGGWYWVDGTPLNYQNWWNSEPNDWSSDLVDGEEDYAQFEFGNNGIRWNDMGLNDPVGQSYPLFEYKAQTSIEWFTIDGGTQTPVPDATNSSEIVVSTAQTTSYMVRVTTNGVVCESDPFIITINALPEANAVSNNQIEICVDDNNSAIASADLKGAFDLTSTYDDIYGLQDKNKHDIAFYTSQIGAENEASAALIQPHNSFPNTSNPQEVFYRVTNTDTGCVSEVNSLMLKAEPLPPTITIPDVVKCDNLDSGSDEDGILRFDLDAQTSTIETLLGSATQYTISYYENLTDAEAPRNAISDYTTTALDNRTKTIVVRIEDNTTGCYRTDITLDLVVAELPKIEESTFVREQCDTDTDGIVQDNLTLYNDAFSTNHQNETFTYYRDSSHTDQILDPTTFMNTTMNQTVYVKITNDNGCERTYDPATGDPLTIDIRVRASTIKDTFLETYYTCLARTNTANDGISTFDKAIFSDLEAKLIAAHPAFTNNNVSIQFFESENNAASKLDPIDTSQDYVNTTPNTQEIWAAVDAVGFTDVTCLGLKHVANLVVEPLAILHPVTIPSQCDGDSPLDLDSQDGKFPFDTATVLDQLLLTQNPADYQITFYDENDVLISTNGFPAVYESSSQTIRVVVENNPSNVSPSCYQEGFITFVVDDSPEVGAYNIAPLCDNDDGSLDGMASFNTNNLNAELLAGQTNMEIKYVQRDGSGNETVLGSSLPNPFVTETTTVIAQIYNPANMNCIMEEYITFQVNENPVFDLPEEQIFCENLGFDTIYITNPSATYNYTWTRNGSAITGKATQNLVINEGGTYVVTATNPVTGCDTTKTINVYTSDIASFLPEDISVFDLTGDGRNRIEVQTSTLGIGDYEFALNDNPYQDSPVFENVPPGVHEISVRDKNGCGIVRHEVSVIGYAYYFTPNNDGKNDTWQILGVSDAFQAQSLIYIFDRHGRLMAQIAADGTGWDGNYNGSPMPADDYWFRVKLEDGRSFTGHFSLVR